MALTDIDGQRLGDSVGDKLGDRNLIINGAMQVAQRATSVTGLTNGSSNYHTVDRFRFGEQGAPTCVFTNTQSTDAPSGFSNSFRLDTTTAESPVSAANTIYTDYRVEAQDLQRLGYGTADAKSITLSFYVKSTVDGTYAVWFYAPDGDVACTHTYTIAAAEVGTWQYRTITVTGNTSNVIDNDNGIGIFIRFVLCAGTDWTSGTASTTWDAASVTEANRFPGHTANVASTTLDDWSITGVQLEVGNTATPFQHRSYADELARCQRYLFRVNGYADDETAIGAGHVRDTGTMQSYVNLPVTMRDIGVVTENDMRGISGATNVSISLTSSFDEGTNCIGVNLDADTGTPFTTGRGALVGLNASTSAFFQVSAEI